MSDWQKHINTIRESSSCGCAIVRCTCGYEAALAGLEALARRVEEAEGDAASWRDRYAAVIACIRELRCPDVSPCLDAYEGDDLACSRCYDLYADRLLAARERSES